jgi:phosphate transport system substrate-binding protein
MTPPLGTGGGIRALNDGRIDLAMSGRPLKAGENGRSIAWLHTPLVLATQGGVLAKGLDEQTIADIYAGRRTQWDNGKPVRLILRGAEETELKILRFWSKEVDVAVGMALKRTDLPVGENDLEALALLARINGSIGTTTLGLLRANGEQIKPLPLNGVSPSLENLNKKNYPLVREYFLVVPASSKPAATAFLDFLQSPAALKLAARYEYGPLSVTSSANK